MFDLQVQQFLVYIFVFHCLSHIFFGFFPLVFLDVFFFFPSFSFSSRFCPFSIILWGKLPTLSPLATSLVYLLICLSAILPTTLSIYLPIFRSVSLDVRLFGMLISYFQMVRRTECTGKLSRNYRIEYDGQNFLKFASKLLDASIWRMWSVARVGLGYCERGDLPGQLGFQVYEMGWSSRPSVILAI